MKAEFKIIVGKRGVITLPKKMRDQNKIKDGDILYMYEISDGVFALKNQPSKLDEIGSQLVSDFKQADVSLEEMLQTIREVRENYDAEQTEDFS